MIDLLKGALAGLVATLPMSGMIALGRASGSMSTPPPRQITANVKRRLGLSAHQSSTEFDLTWTAAHLAYGAACGAVYGAARPYLSTPPIPTGLVYGSLIWAASYLGAMPALGLYPWPKHDTRGRAETMVLAHLVFGAVLALLLSPRARRRQASRPAEAATVAGAPRFGAQLAG